MKYECLTEQHERVQLNRWIFHPVIIGELDDGVDTVSPLLEEEAHSFRVFLTQSILQFLDKPRGNRVIGNQVKLYLCFNLLHGCAHWTLELGGEGQ